MALSIIASISLSACAVHEPAQIRARTGAVTPGQSIALAEAEEGSGLRSDFRNALAASFAAVPLMLDEDGALIGDFGIAIQDARMGQVLDPSDDDTLHTIDWQAQPRVALIFDGCDPVRAQATLALFDRSTGNVVYRGEAEALACEASHIDLNALAEELVHDVAVREAEQAQP